jgi:undecaprenyl diphosphate synthase
LNGVDKARVKTYNFWMQNRFKFFVKEGSREEDLLLKINKKKLPRHVAIIMDGNGRWAKKRKLNRIEGHLEGAKSALIIAECSSRIGIKYLTLFVFSSENWKRPPWEVNKLMDLLYKNLTEKSGILSENKIKLRTIGDLGKIPPRLRKKLFETEKMSGHYKNLQINLALSYGARNEIINAVRKIIIDNVSASDINEKLFENYLNTHDCPDPDLLIRTSGELRISNFLLYQIAYSELYFTQTLWPDFKVYDYLKAIKEYQERGRRFGAI